MKTCYKCKEEKNVEDFYFRNKAKGIRRSLCKECDKARVKKRHEENPLRAKHNDLMRKYGITLEDHTKMFEDQKGVCAICRKPGDGRWESLCVDHCHTTNNVRALLCRNCNMVLGQVNDNVDLLQSCIDYLNKYKES